MKFLKLRLDAFHEYVCPVEVELAGRGLVLVEGVNLDSQGAFDSNGAGKSLLFEAICWVLWNTMPRYRGKWLTNELAAESGKTDATLWVQIAGSTYRFHRWRTKAAQGFTVQREGEPEPRAFDAKRAVEDVNKLVGFDFDTLRAALFLQGIGMDFATAKFDAQNALLESVLRFYILSEARDFATADKNEATQLHAVVAERLKVLEPFLQQARARIADLEKLPENTSLRIEEAEHRIVNLLDATDEAQINLLTQQIADLDAKAAVQRVSQTEKKLDLETAGRKLNELRLQQQASREGKCPTCGQVTKKSSMTVEQRDQLDAQVVEQERTTDVLNREYLAGNDTLNAVYHERTRRLEEVNGLRHLRKTLLPQLQASLEALQGEEARRVAQLESERARLAETEAEFAKVSADVAVAKARLDKAAVWVKGFPELKAKLLKVATPVLNGYAVTYSRLLADGQLNVAFESEREKRTQDLLRITDERGRPREYASCSAGERRRIDLIASLSLRSLARWRMAEAINLTLYDEVFDPLDPAGIARVAGVLQRDLEDLESVFVVTHNPLLKKEFPGASVMRVVRRGHHIEVHQ